MATYTQATRALRLETVLGPDKLVVTGLNGSEAVSAPFEFNLDLTSTDPAISGADLLQTGAAVVFVAPDGTERRINGLIRRFGTQGRQRHDLTTYSVEIVPTLWLLTLHQDCRVYQNLTTLDIVEKVFKQFGVEFEVRCTASYTPREYCVQYRETYFQFISRLLEDEGIFYFFEHDETKHTVVLVDRLPAKPIDGTTGTLYSRDQAGAMHEAVSDTARDETLHVGAVHVQDYDPLQPNFNLLSTAAGAGAGSIYDFPGTHDSLEEGERVARILLEAEESLREQVTGSSNTPRLQPGRTVVIADAWALSRSDTYSLLEVRHLAVARQLAGAAESTPFDYSNRFRAVPSDVPYRTLPNTPKPVIRGSQTAVVVGPKGEELYTDKYGRVKIQFHWDREGKRDENSSCWVRVAQPWAGKGYGTAHLPRIDNEVVVHFLDGDPDRPVVIGSLYNADQTPPFGVSGSGVEMGIKSRTSPGGGGMNQISVNDTKGKELITIHAQHDMTTTVEHDKSNTVINDESLTVKKGNRTIKVETGTHTEEIKGNTSITILTGNNKLDVQTGTHTHHVKADVTENYDANQKTTVKKTITIDGGDSITLKSGKSSITLLKDGTITIQGKDINIIATKAIKESGDTVEVTGSKTAKLGVSNQQVTCDTQKVNVSGAAINSSAVGMHEITGALVKIN